MSLFTSRHDESESGTPQAAFTRGSIIRHVVTASLASALGLLVLFSVDLVDIFFISLLGEAELAAAVGFAGTILFLCTSIGIAVVITVATTLSKLVGAGAREEAKRFYMHSLAYSLAISVPVTLLLFFFAGQILALLGAEGQTLRYATDYIRIILPVFPLTLFAFTNMAVLRAHGDFGLLTVCTLVAGAVTGVFDPLLIFYFDLGLHGAAIAALLSRISLFALTAYFVVTRYDFFSWPLTHGVRADRARYTSIFIPSLLSNIATPFGTGFVTNQMAQFGDSFVAGMSVIGRTTPVVFCVVFALSGAIGPIIGQNLGAKLFDRVRKTIGAALLFSTLYVLLASLTLWLVHGTIIETFRLTEGGALLLRFYTTFISLSFIFTGAIFIANAALNTLGRPTYATAINIFLNIGLLIPLALLGAYLGGPTGILVGQAASAAIACLFAFFVVRHVLSQTAHIGHRAVGSARQEQT